MWIINHNDATRRLYAAWMADHVDDVRADLPGEGRGVVFDGPVQIDADVGEQLIDRYPPVEAYDAETDSDS
jgi:hypothetical protein